MSSTAIATMVLVLAIVWGGFLFILGTAFVKERHKKAEEARSSGRAPGS